jgi:two-component system, sensor histidine kinase LadS
MLQKVFLGLTFLLVSIFSVQAQPLQLTAEGRFDLRDHLFHLRDTTNRMSIVDVVDHTKDFQKTDIINFGFDEATHWFFFEAINTGDDAEWFLEIPFAPLDEVDLFYERNGKWQRKVAGDIYPVSIRELRYQNPVFRIRLAANEPGKFYLRIKSSSSVQVAVSVWSPYHFFQDAYDRQIFNGLFYGALAVMMLYQLFLFMSTRDRVSLYYVFTLLAMTHVVAYFQGYSFLYLYPDSPGFNDPMGILIGPFFLVCSTALTRSFLNLRSMNRYIDILLLVNTGVDVLLGIAMLFFDGGFFNRYHHIAVLLHSLLALSAAAYSIYRNYKPALFYLLSWLTLLVAAFIFSLSNLGVFSHNITNSTWLIVGCIVQILFVSFALGSRWFIMTRENQQARELELRRRQLEKEKLEVQVQVRTNEIQRKNEELEELGRVKDKLFSVVSHDIKGPLTSLQLALSLFKNNTIRQHEFQELAEVLETRFRQTTEFIENLLQWASIQLKGSVYNPVRLEMEKVAGATLGLLEDDVKQKDVSVSVEFQPGVIAFADINMLRSVFRNLLVNAIKFSRKGGLIVLGGWVEGEHVIVKVSDNGIGIPDANKAKMFSLDSITTLGTQKEKGTGLGLLICRELIEKNKGRIWFESQEDQGTTFFFTLPVYREKVIA